MASKKPQDWRLVKLAQNLRAFRESLPGTEKGKCSHVEFGKRFGYDGHKIGNIERGTVNFPILLLIDILTQGYPIDAILDGILPPGMPTRRLLAADVLRRAFSNVDQSFEVFKSTLSSQLEKMEK